MGVTVYSKQEMLGFFQVIEHQVLTYLQQEHVEDVMRYDYDDYGFKFTPTGEEIYSRIIDLEDDINYASDDDLLIVDEEAFNKWVSEGYDYDIPWHFTLHENR